MCTLLQRMRRSLDMEDVLHGQIRILQSQSASAADATNEELLAEVWGSLFQCLDQAVDGGLGEVHVIVKETEGSVHDGALEVCLFC